MLQYQNLFGLTVALATPLSADGRFDKEGMRKLVNYTVASGVSNIFTLGVAGEVLAFDRETRRLIVKTVKEFSKDRVPLIAGVIDSSTELVLRNILDAKELGANYALSTAPNFYKLTQEEMEKFFLNIADKGGLPIIIYNCSWAKNHLLPETVARLAGHPNIVALKETSDMVRLQQMKDALMERDDFVLISGEEYLFLPALSIGIKAFMMGGPGNILPRQCLEIMEDFNNHRLADAARKYNNMFSFLSQLYSLRIFDMAAVKSVLEIAGICSRYVTKPFESATDSEILEITALMEKYNISL